MTTTTRPLYRRPSSRRLLLLLLVGALAVALVVTFLQVRPQSYAAEVVDGITVSTVDAKAEITTEEGECHIESRTNISGPEDRVHEFIDSVSKSAQQSGFTTETNGLNPAPGAASIDLSLSKDFPLSDTLTAEACTTESAIVEHRGRKALELPGWARGLVAAAAAMTVYLVIVFAVTALFTFLAPAVFYLGELIGGCVGGFASTFVANYINGVNQDANLVQSGVQCVAGAILNVSLSQYKQQMVTALNGWLHQGSVAALSEGVSLSAGHAGEMSEQFGSLSADYGDALQAMFDEP